MIRTDKKIYGEANDTRTVTVIGNELIPNKFVTKPAGNAATKSIASFDITPRSLLVVRDGRLEPFNYNSPNKLIGTDDNGSLVAFTRNELPDSPPNGTPVLVEEILGSTQPDGILVEKSILLEGPYWYEVEVAGCGGGGGSGAALAKESKDIKDGKSGGEGGHYRGVFPVRETTYCIAQIGCPGGGASGYVVNNTDKTAKLTSGGPNGGDGGRTPILYEGTFSGVDGAKQNLETQIQQGGAGFYSSANGGSVYGWKTAVIAGGDSYAGAGAGGAAVGGYGGAGGNSGPYNVSDATASVDKYGYIGGAGGAGGGFGLGGDGGDGWSKAAETYGNGGKSYGGGGGGGCANATATELQSAGCGGGGGGGARFKCNDFEVLCGGGGGGCGGGDISWQHTDGRYSGGKGYNNKNSETGGGGAGGVGGAGLHTDEKVARNTSGSTGSRGWIRIWRRVK